MIVSRKGVAGAIYAALTMSAFAQTPPPDLVKARTAFAAAVLSNNETAAAELSAFPLINRVYQEKPTLPRSEFRGLLKTYRELAKCLRSEKLTAETSPRGKSTGNWRLDCDGNVVLFGQKGGRWLHIGYENVNE